MISFNKVKKLKSFKFGASDVIPTNAQIISFHIFISFMENEISAKFNGVFCPFLEICKVTKFWIIRFCLDVSDVINSNEQT